MSSFPEVDHMLDATIDSIRAVLAEHDGSTDGARAEVARLVRDVVARYGPDAGTTVAIFLATAAAYGFAHLADRTGDPVDAVLHQFEQGLRADTEFDLVVGGEFPASRADG